MNREFINLLAEYGTDLMGYFRYAPQGQYNSYDTLFSIIVDKILNAQVRRWDTDNIVYLSNGSTKEDRILIVPPIKKELLVCDYLITHAYYEPMFGVEMEDQEALDFICQGRPDLPSSEEQARRYMKHVWELVLNIRQLG